MQIITKKLGLTVYNNIYQNMINFTKNRNLNTHDEIWLLEHNKVFTQGRHINGKHFINSSHDIPIMQTDRGGQVTNHAPGQAIIYCLFDLRRLNIGIKIFVSFIERSCMNLLKKYGIVSHTIKDYPGIYVNNKKIASIGLRIKNGFTYHGIAINTDMNLSPFNYIYPCGYRDLKMTQIKDHIQYDCNINVDTVLDDYDVFIKEEITSNNSFYKTNKII